MKRRHFGIASIHRDEHGSFTLERDIDPAMVRQLFGAAPIAKLTIHKAPRLTVRLAQRLAGLPVDHLNLWSEVTRRALRDFITLPGLRALDVLALCGAGRVVGFGKSRLEVVRINHYLRESELLEIARCESLRELGAQNANLTPRALAALLALPQLTTLDVEATRFDDRMARRISRSTTLAKLDLGGVPITGAGLEHLVRMEQLRELDLWATGVTGADLHLLAQLPNLEYVSLGHYGGMSTLDAELVTQTLLALPALRRVWLDGIRLAPAQRKALEERLEHVRLN